jgi:hypothetical protein
MRRASGGSVSRTGSILLVDRFKVLRFGLQSASAMWAAGERSRWTALDARCVLRLWYGCNRTPACGLG